MVIYLSSVEGMQNDFIADVSHEIKTPLSVIQGYADLLIGGKTDGETTKEYIALMTSEIHKLNDLVTNVLKINKIQNSGITISEKFFLDEQIRCRILSFIEKIEENNIELELDLPETVDVCGKYPLEMVWNNLLENAVKYSNVGGKISVAIKKENDNLAVCVKDTGIGMSEETQKHMFEKFYQGDISHSTKGNGLGLALVKKVADGMGAEIKVRSELGKGSDIQFIFPVFE